MKKPIWKTVAVASVVVLGLAKFALGVYQGWKIGVALRRDDNPIPPEARGTP